MSAGPLLRHGHHRALILAALVVLAAAAAASVLRIGFPHPMVVVRHSPPERQPAPMGDVRARTDRA